MTDLEIGVICFINEFSRRNLYRYENYQLLHDVKYKKAMDEKYLNLIRDRYKKNCFEAAYELKTYYMENGLLSNTIVLKMRPESPELQEFKCIKIHSELDGADHEYTHHAIEIFKEDGKYKVLDILHCDVAVFLEKYLDNVCRTNNCPREQLRYDMGYLAPCHAFAGNMQELSDLIRYLDKKYNIGKPRLNVMNIPGARDDALLLSDDIIMDFDIFGRPFGTDGKNVINAWKRVYDGLMGTRFNILHMLCLGHIMRDSIAISTTAALLFDDVEMCQLMDRVGTDAFMKERRRI